MTRTLPGGERPGTPGFVTFEGGEGVGKTTQLRLLAADLAAVGVEAVATREPGGTPAAEAIRALLLDPSLSPSPEAEILLHFAARAEHLERVVRPALARGALVLCDRFVDSTLAYQHFGAGADRTLIDLLACRLPVRPRLTLMFAADEAVRRARLEQRPGGADRYERMDPAFHARVAAGFDAIAARDPGRCVRIDANGDAATVARAVRTAVAPLLAPAAGPARPR